MRERLIIALDLPDAPSALAVAQQLKGQVAWVKVGMTLYYAEGPAIVRELCDLGFKVFVDLKLHDIPYQVRGACRTLVRAGADLITVHASGGREMLRVAVEEAGVAAEESGVPKPAVVAVTVLTSLAEVDLAEIGWERDAREQVELLGRLAQECGCDGVVCSPEEAAALRQLLGPDALIVTPGVRPAWADAGDQSRTATPAEALAAGSSLLVIGRPVTGAADPVHAVRLIVEGDR